MTNDICPCDKQEGLMGFCAFLGRPMPVEQVNICRRDEGYREGVKVQQKVVNIPHPNGGPGTELSKILKKFGIKATPTCNCKHYARIMDQKGSEWCLQNIDTIVNWLRDEAKKRALPFSKIVAKRLVKYAINRHNRKIAEKAV
jgi:hypothetical protein